MNHYDGPMGCFEDYSGPDRNQPSLQKRGQQMYEKGYRYCVEFAPTSRIEPLFVKTLGEIGPLIQRDFPNEKDYRGYEINMHGEEIKRWHGFIVTTEDGINVDARLSQAESEYIYDHICDLGDPPDKTEAGIVRAGSLQEALEKTIRRQWDRTKQMS